jgi:LysR family hydrogen peroxide-inducible transcriptional activator
MRFQPHPFTLRQLQYVVAIADWGSFKKAAEACAVSQPALSAQVAQLENTLGARLFERKPQAVPTPIGETFITKARDLLTRADETLVVGLSRGHALPTTLRIGVLPTIGPYLLPRLALSLRQSFAAHHFVWSEQRTQELLTNLRDQQLDAAILALETVDTRGLEIVDLGEDPFLLALPHDHYLATAPGNATSDKLPIEVLSEERVLVLEDGHCFGSQVRDICKRSHAGDFDVCGTSLGTLCQMVVGGLGITLLPRLAVEVENRLGTLRLRDFEAPPKRSLALVWTCGSPYGDAANLIAPTLREELLRVAAGPEQPSASPAP